MNVQVHDINVIMFLFLFFFCAFVDAVMHRTMDVVCSSTAKITICRNTRTRRSHRAMSAHKSFEVNSVITKITFFILIESDIQYPYNMCRVMNEIVLPKNMSIQSVCNVHSISQELIQFRRIFVQRTL